MAISARADPAGKMDAIFPASTTLANMSDSSGSAVAPAAALCGLPGLGPKSAAMLASAGIRSVESLRGLGAVAAFLRVRAAGCKPSLNLLWSMEGALTGMPWVAVARTERTRLLLQMDDMRAHRDAPGPAAVGPVGRARQAGARRAPPARTTG
jgi:DNA transformation protein